MYYGNNAPAVSRPRTSVRHIVFRRVCFPCNSIPLRTGYNFIQWFSGFGASAPRLSRGQIAQVTEGLKMKKLVLALTAIAAFTGSAVAADLPARTYTKAPYVAPAPSWTGFYIFGGGGGGIWAADNGTQATATGIPLGTGNRAGGSGWYGTVGAGYDWQVNQGWVIGILADGQFGSIRGQVNDTFFNLTGQETLRTSWAAGGRVGYLVAPNVLSYVNAGYTGSEWSGATLSSAALGGAALTTTPSFNRNGWFIGGGVENNLDIFGINIPGLFMKTEYRAAFYGNINLPETVIATGLLGTGTTPTFKSWNETVSTSLVYRFNWAGPVVAKY
jgi:outer membrane immunogenic protein